jgi:hypothetical protein
VGKKALPFFVFSVATISRLAKFLKLMQYYVFPELRLRKRLEPDAAALRSVAKKIFLKSPKWVTTVTFFWYRIYKLLVNKVLVATTAASVIKVQTRQI